MLKEKLCDHGWCELFDGLFFNVYIVLFVYCERLLVYVNVNSWKESLQILCLHFCISVLIANVFLDHL